MMLVTKYKTINTARGDSANNPFRIQKEWRNDGRLKRHTILKYSNFTIVILFVASKFPIGYSQNFVNKIWNKLLHVADFNELAGRKIYPVRFVLGKHRVRGTFHCGNNSAERSTTTCSEKHDMTTTGRQCC